ncbi:hypothetical protein [Sulfuricurvum sp. RIFCSPLOWO2_12_FULL_43_24]|uniref:hypothetical protein n=1 Tax=Sulfuricurvum sp. RIFCSPLOWO2_12_FULL_43_24 TaxID=1802247 RepID=UPI0008C771F3|nr:hypothetical protein [Sulfuricurvum sp. RIFCSPLOWO2_12_FULL_43_24]OHD90695.1 MAG: hypothetical protein A3G19_04100 [Sulfuricurvum sp. RIFCSPLOWO2_12_FULL_43_24]
MIIAARFYEGQGLGNQLWVHAVGRSIAEYLEVPFVQLNMDKFKGKDFLEIDEVVLFSENEQVSFDELSELPVFHETRYYDPDLKVVSSDFDERVTHLTSSVELEGFFQSERYFFGDMDRLNRYFRLTDQWKTSVNIPDDTCILNIRGGEYKRHKNLILPLEYWNHAIRNIRENTAVNRFLIVTDDVAYAKALFPEYDILQGGVGECYAALYNAKAIVLSNSSFGYFPTKTNPNKPYVIAPRYWARFNNAYQRWASPANLYQDWLWQDYEGRLGTYDEMRVTYNRTIEYYKNNYFISTSPEVVYPKPLSRFLSQRKKQQIKKILSRLFPMKFG